MLHRSLLIGILAIGVAACSDDAPSAMSPVDGGNDRSFSFPVPVIVEPNTRDQGTSSEIDWSKLSHTPTAALDSAQAYGSDLITELVVEAGFTDFEDIAYAGTHARSTGHYLRTVANLTLRKDGSVIGTVSQPATDARLINLPIFLLHASAMATLPVTGQCGHTVSNAGVAHAEVRFWDGDRVTATEEDEDSENDHASQPACPPRGSGGGGSGDEQWYICTYNDWYDVWGNFLYREETGCMPIDTPMT